MTVATEPSPTVPAPAPVEAPILRTDRQLLEEVYLLLHEQRAYSRRVMGLLDLVDRHPLARRFLGLP